MAVFFQFIAAFALFFGVAALVFSTEFSKRARLLIDARMDEVENEVARRIHKQDLILEGALQDMRQSLKHFEESQYAQTREINALRSSLDTLLEDLEKRTEEQKKIEAFLDSHRRRA